MVKYIKFFKIMDLNTSRMVSSSSYKDTFIETAVRRDQSIWLLTRPLLSKNKRLLLDLGMCLILGGLTYLYKTNLGLAVGGFFLILATLNYASSIFLASRQKSYCDSYALAEINKLEKDTEFQAKLEAVNNTDISTGFGSIILAPIKDAVEADRSKFNDMLLAKDRETIKNRLSREADIIKSGSAFKASRNNDHINGGVKPLVSDLQTVPLTLKIFFSSLYEKMQKEKLILTNRQLYIIKDILKEALFELEKEMLYAATKMNDEKSDVGFERVAYNATFELEDVNKVLLKLLERVCPHIIKKSGSIYETYCMLKYSK